MGQSRHTRLRCIWLTVVLALAVAVAGCGSSDGDSSDRSATPPAPAPAGTAPTPTGRYVKPVFKAEQVSASSDVTYATVPDVSGERVDLALTVYSPDAKTDPQPTGRPVIIWLYGGAFRVGSKAQVTDVARAYARHGFVTVTPNYRLDPGSTCDSPSGEVDLHRCNRAVFAAQHDIQAAVRWVRAHATDLGVDPTKIAAAGFSAGATTAALLAYRSDDPGDSGNPGYGSQIQAALAASGFEFQPEHIGAGDAPLSIVISKNDRLAPYRFAQANVAAARAAGLVIELRDYDGGLHARALYDAHRAEIDTAWIAFLVAQLQLT